MSELVCGIHHVGINVPDLEAARRFYQSVFGFEVIGIDRWQEGNSDINAFVGLDESAANSYMLKGSNTYLELWQYDTPASRSAPGERCAADYGYTHLCFTVRDFDAVLDKFIAAGGSPIKPLTKARPGGSKIHYCQDPFGNIIELLQMPEASMSTIRHLPAVAEEAVYDPPAEQYYLLENGHFAGMRDKSELP